MTTAVIAYPYGGCQPIGNSGSFVEVADTDATAYRPLIPVGAMVNFAHPYYGDGRAIRLVVPKNTTAIKVGTLALAAAATNAQVLSNFSFVIVPVTASQNKPVFVAMNAVPLNASFCQYAWFALTGTLPVLATVATAITDKMHISASAGAAFVTATLGRLLQGLTPVVASTGTVAKANTKTTSGSAVLEVSDSDGWFIGGSVAGAGIATSLITAISGDGRLVTLASVATATGSVTATMTLNDATSFFPVCQFLNGINAQFLAT